MKTVFFLQETALMSRMPLECQLCQVGTLLILRTIASLRRTSEPAFSPKLSFHLFTLWVSDTENNALEQFSCYSSRFESFPQKLYGPQSLKYYRLDYSRKSLPASVLHKSHIHKPHENKSLSTLASVKLQWDHTLNICRRTFA